MILGLILACKQADDQEVGAPNVYFNELVADNDSGLRDDERDFDDWVEIAVPDGIDLSGWTLTSELEEDAEPMVMVPGTAGSDGFLIVTCDDEEGGTHAPFSLDPFGGDLVLTDGAGGYVDEVRFPIMRTDMAWAREDDGGWTDDPTPSPGQANGF